MSHKQQYRREYAGLNRITSDLLAAGVECYYKGRAVHSTGLLSRLLGVDFTIVYIRSNASNGECALFPWIRVGTPGGDKYYHGLTYDTTVKFIVDTLGYRKVKAGSDLANVKSDGDGDGEGVTIAGADGRFIIQRTI